MKNTLIEAKHSEILQLCEQYRVRRLELFGSAAEGRFREDESDLDFLVEFQNMAPGQHADAYFGLLAALQDLFQRDIDLIEIRAIQNPYFRDSVEQNRTLLYAA
jgi:predicted nucleotidyltransferase